MAGEPLPAVQPQAQPQIQIDPAVFQKFGMQPPPMTSVDVIRQIMPYLPPDLVHYVAALMHTPDEFTTRFPQYAPPVDPTSNVPIPGVNAPSGAFGDVAAGGAGGSPTIQPVPMPIGGQPRDPVMPMPMPRRPMPEPPTDGEPRIQPVPMPIGGQPRDPVMPMPEPRRPMPTPPETLPSEPSLMPKTRRPTVGGGGPVNTTPGGSTLIASTPTPAAAAAAPRPSMSAPAQAALAKPVAPSNAIGKPVAGANRAGQAGTWDPGDATHPPRFLPNP